VSGSSSSRGEGTGQVPSGTVVAAFYIDASTDVCAGCGDVARYAAVARIRRIDLCARCATDLARELGTVVAQRSPKSGRALRRHFGLVRRKTRYTTTIPTAADLTQWLMIANELGDDDVDRAARDAITTLVHEIDRLRKVIGERGKTLMTKIQAWKAFRMGIVASGALVPPGDVQEAQDYWRKMRGRFVQWFADYLSQGQPGTAAASAEAVP